MAEQLKAVVSVTADTSGLVRGVEGAMSRLDSIGRNVSLLSGLTIGGSAISAIGRIIATVQERATRFEEAALDYSPDAQRAEQRRKQQEEEQRRRIGEMMGPSQIAIAMVKSQFSTQEMRRVAQSQEAIGFGRIYGATLLESIKAGASAVGESFMRRAADDVSPTEVFGLSSFFEATGATDLVAQQYGRILPYLDRIVEKMGGEP